MTRHAGPSGNRATVLAAIVVLVVLATGLVFVLLLRPAADEFNNTIPAVMGILTMITAAVPALLALLKSEQTVTSLAAVATQVETVATQVETVAVQVESVEAKTAAVEHAISNGLIGGKMADALAVHDELIKEETPT